VTPPTIETTLHELISEIRDPEDLEAGYNRLKPELLQAIEDDVRLTATEKEPLKSILAGSYKCLSNGEPAPHRLLLSLTSSLMSKKTSQAGSSRKPEHANPNGDHFMTLDDAIQCFSLDQLPKAYGIRGYRSSETIVNVPLIIGDLPVVSICDKAFSECLELEEVYIPSSVMELGIEAFSGCRSLKKVVLPDSLQSIGSKAFAGCEKLSEIKLPGGIRECGGRLFDGCNELKSIGIPNTFRKLGNALAGCSGIVEVEIPESVTEIGVGAFRNCRHLEKVTIPDSVSKIWTGAFDGCENLRHVDLPSSLVDFPQADRILAAIHGNQGRVFSNLDALQQVTVRFSNKPLAWSGGEAFFECRSLKTITVKGDVDRLSGSFFEGFNQVTDIRILAPVKVICDSAFKDCSSLERIEIPDTVIKIGPGAFEGCCNLKELLIGPDNPAFMFRDGVLFDNTMSKLLFCIRIKEGAYSIPECVVEVCSKAFANCIRLKSVSSSESVDIAADAFDGLFVQQDIEIGGITRLDLEPDNP
jgi:hypothetical protein